ncbi:Two-component response regulator SSK1p, partial [Cryomyces antarcticus]
PVNFVWLERKVKEWGCMQALIDFDGWRKWKDFAAQNGQPSDSGKKDAGKKVANKVAENASAAKMDKEKKKAAGAGAKVGMAGKKVEGTGVDVDVGGAVDSVGLDLA